MVMSAMEKIRGEEDAREGVCDCVRFLLYLGKVSQ